MSDQQETESDGESVLMEPNETQEDSVDTVLNILESQVENSVQSELQFGENEADHNSDSHQMDIEDEDALSDIPVYMTAQYHVSSDATIHNELSPHIQCVRELGFQPEDFVENTSEDSPLFTVSNKSDEQQNVNTVVELLSILMVSANRGMTLTRYKGLAEMNAKQLKETTMQSDVRILLQVTMEDAVQAERMFTLLMGDASEPRRAFIERYGTQVELDVYGA